MDTTPIVGLIPAAGVASRLQPLPFSKELYPIGFESENGSIKSPKPVATYLLEHMRAGGAEQVYVILRNGKWDIPAYYGDGSRFGVSMAYLLMGLPYGAPFSADQAYSFVKDKRVLFGFPDILMAQQNVFARLLAKQTKTNADVVLGVFEVEEPARWDVVRTLDNGSVQAVYPKPHHKPTATAWAFACWGPAFTALMHAQVQAYTASIVQGKKASELSMGHMLAAAIEQGLRIDSVKFSKDFCLDVGTPEDLQKAIRKYS